jgi:ribosome-associated protein
MSKVLKTNKVQQWVRDALEDAKAQNIVVLDVSKISDFTDYMVIATGTSNRHVQSCADRVLDDLRSHERRPVGVEGKQNGDWVLVDFGDVVVHVMRDAVRDFYNLEKLWSDAKSVEVKEKAAPEKIVAKAKAPRKPKAPKAVKKRIKKKR